MNDVDWGPVMTDKGVMPPAFSSLSAMLEHDVITSCHPQDHRTMALASIAISLKRIADQVAITGGKSK